MAMMRSRSRKERRRPTTPLARYAARTHKPLNCLVFVLPFILVYEVGVATLGTDLLARRQLGHLLRQLGATVTYLPAALVIVVLLVWQLVSKHRWRVNGRTVLWMYVEGIALSIPLIGIAMIRQRLALASAGWVGDLAANPHATEVLVGIGGGVYEEFLFRLLGLNLCSLLLVDIIELPEDVGYPIAATVCSLLFAWYHFLGQGPILWSSFVFFFLAGMYLSFVYIIRGYGVSVGTHISYNLFVAGLGTMA